MLAMIKSYYTKPNNKGSLVAGFLGGSLKIYICSQELKIRLFKIRLKKRVKIEGKTVQERQNNY